jgi:hypothetical protein
MNEDIKTFVLFAVSKLLNSISMRYFVLKQLILRTALFRLVIKRLSLTDQRADDFHIHIK